MENNHIFNVAEVCECTQPDVGQVDQMQVADDQAGPGHQVQRDSGAVLNCHQGLIVTDSGEAMS